MNLSLARHIHILGIGGIGVSALARLLHGQGKTVTGQDTGLSEVTRGLEAEGIKVSKGQRMSAVPKGTDVMVYSNAIPIRTPHFFTSLKKLGIPMLSYPEALGEVSKEKFTIAVSGTHGKTTTTAMIAKILMDAKLSPSVIVGSLMKEVNSNFVSGKSDILVVEADDYQRAFLNLSPDILVITNIGLDHLDYYKDLKDIESAFLQLSKRVKKNGYIIIDKSASYANQILKSSKARAIDVREFAYKNLKLQVPGKHNRENAAAACAVAHIQAVPKKSAMKSLNEFSGTWRRFDFKGNTASGALVYDDYAHNPDKVRAAISGYREAFPEKNIIVVFQPHLYSRTRTLLKEFSDSFNEASEILVAPIFAAREKKDPTVSSEKLADSIKISLASKGMKIEVRFFKNFQEIEKYLKGRLSSDDVLVTMGAGDVYKIAEDLIK